MNRLSLLDDSSLAPERVAGVDEAGRGCLAGPVVAGAVILPVSYDLPGLNDSKKLTAATRETLYEAIRTQAVCWAVGVAWPTEIDRINILQATFMAMGRAVRHLKADPLQLLIDGNKTIPPHALERDIAQKFVIQGDGKIPAISAASIMAKTFRDRLMCKLAGRYPGYGFDVHMGYGTKVHYEALSAHGPCRMHRMTFRGVVPEKKVEQGSLL
ncbi:ribonuclease HII [Salidesulfovibrio onnuriiensis]|uniref:ribonuclease HII n=1 Tax=Salidesulfovibrio onnuriiensis TaxID=2583823 RepID=UPI0011C7B758|nr:ribonuclease HII [Salidesulfovibrio onnuriiensis]